MVLLLVPLCSIKEVGRGSRFLGLHKSSVGVGNWLVGCENRHFPSFGGEYQVAERSGGSRKCKRTEIRSREALNKMWAWVRNSCKGESSEGSSKAPRRVKR